MPYLWHCFLAALLRYRFHGLRQRSRPAERFRKHVEQFDRSGLDASRKHAQRVLVVESLCLFMTPPNIAQHTTVDPTVLAQCKQTLAPTTCN